MTNGTSPNQPVTDFTLPEKKGPLSGSMVSTLRYVGRHHVKLSALQIAHGSTLGALCGRGYLAVQDGYVLLSNDGAKALRIYDLAEMRRRLVPGDLTERCITLLHISKALIQRQAIHQVRSKPKAVA